MKRRTCKHCKARFTAEELAQNLALHQVCIDPFIVAFNAKQAKKRAAKMRADEAKAAAELRVRKAALKRIPDLLKEARDAFNAYIRERDREQSCICCGLPWGTANVGGSYDAGHYRSVGSAPHLRFDEANVHGQRKHCNRYGAGRAVDYRIGLIKRIGLAGVERLESDNRIHKWTREELISIRDTYKAKLKEMKS